MLRLIERWLADHQRLVLATILLASVLLRVGYFLELNQGPCLRQHLWDQSDMNFFDLWARDIAAGDWLTDKVLHPYHIWHKKIAAAYFRMHPEAAASLLQDGASPGTPTDPGHALWNRWYGGKAFHQEPLYPYLIALTYKVFGAEVRWVFFWQMLLGVGSNVLVYLIARRHFGVVVAAVAGLLAVFCSPMLFYNNVLLRATLIIFMGLLLVYLTDLALARNSWRWLLLTGLACGLAVLVKSTFIPFWLGMLGLLAYRYWGTPRVLLRSIVALTLGLAICLLPVVARNVAVGVPPLKLGSVGTITFITFNVENYPPEAGVFFDFKHASRIMGQTGGNFSAAVIETLKTHSSLWSYLEQLWRKFRVLWHWYEFPNNTNFYYYRLHSQVLQYLPVTFLILAPLSLAGLALAIGHRIPCGPLYLAVFVNLSTLLLSGVTSRYRVALMALLIPFAAWTVVRIMEWLGKKQRAKAMGALVVVFLLSWWTMRPLPQRYPLIRPVDYLVPYDIYYNPLVQEARKQNDWLLVAQILEKSFRSEPVVVQQMGSDRPARNRGEAQLASWYARVHYWYARALQKSGRREAALEQKRRAAALRQATQGTRAR